MTRFYAIGGIIIAQAILIGAVWHFATGHENSRMLREIAERRAADIQQDREDDEEVRNLSDDELLDVAREWLLDNSSE